MSRLPDDYFDSMYSRSADPWDLGTRWYERRKYAITLALLPQPTYRHAFEPGCSVGVLTALLSERCDHLTATDVAQAALQGAQRRIDDLGRHDQVTLLRQSIDEPWPTGPFDLLMLSEVGYYLTPGALQDVLERECAQLAPDATIVTAHWRHRVEEYYMAGDQVNAVVAAIPGLRPVGSYRDADVAIDVFDTGQGLSVAAQSGVPIPST